LLRHDIAAIFCDAYVEAPCDHPQRHIINGKCFCCGAGDL
jgi:hypothetical protein